MNYKLFDNIIKNTAHINVSENRESTYKHEISSCDCLYEYIHIYIYIILYLCYHHVFKLYVYIYPNSIYIYTVVMI